MQPWVFRRPIVVEAIQSILSARRWDELEPIIDRDFFALSVTDPGLVGELLTRVPEEWLVKHPRYLMALSFGVTFTMPFGEMNESVLAVFTDWVASQASPAGRDVLGVLVANTRGALALGQVGRAVGWADQADRVIVEAGDTTGFADVLPPALLALGVVRLYSGQVGKAVGAFAEAWHVSVAGDEHPIAGYAAGYRALGYALAGECALAGRWLGEADRAGEAGPVGSLSWSLSGAYQLAVVLAAVESGDRATAQAGMETLQSRASFEELWWIGVHARARYALVWGDRAAAIEMLECCVVERPFVAGPGVHVGMVLRADLADLHQSVSDYRAADRVLGEVKTLPSDPTVLASRARLHLHRGAPAQALRLLQVDPARAGGPPVVWWMLRANAEHLLGHTGALEQTVRRASEAIRRSGSYGALAEAIPEVRALLDAALGWEGAAGVPVGVAYGSDYDLTAREAEIWDLLLEYRTVQALAGVLFLSPNTVKSHLRGLYRKLGVRSREDAIARANPTVHRPAGPQSDDD